MSSEFKIFRRYNAKPSFSCKKFWEGSNSTAEVGCYTSTEIWNRMGVKFSLKTDIQGMQGTTSTSPPLQLCDGDIDEVGVVDHLILNSYLTNADCPSDSDKLL